MNKIYDPVHGFIRFNAFERQLISSAPFQRLHDIRQLGMAYQVYPGATHTRFEHSLGTMELSARIFDQLSSEDTPDFAYFRQIIRLSALCHDLGHLPFSHAAEKELLGESGHERWTLAAIQSKELAPLWGSLQAHYPDKKVVEDIAKMAIGEKKLALFCPSLIFSSWERVFSQIITGDFFGADRIDYLLRDAQCTGVSYGLFDYHQLIETLRVLPWEGALELGVEENGIESCEALLLARYFMHKRVYQYGSVKAYGFHLSRFLKTCFTVVEDVLNFSDAHVLVEIAKAAKDSAHVGHKDALALTERSKRFQAIALPRSILPKDLKEIKLQHAIPDQAIGWEFCEEGKGKRGLSFPVLKKNQAIEHASSCSEILIPSKPINYVYVAQPYSRFFEKL